MADEYLEGITKGLRDERVGANRATDSVELLFTKGDFDMALTVLIESFQEVFHVDRWKMVQALIGKAAELSKPERGE